VGSRESWEQQEPTEEEGDAMTNKAEEGEEY
jgi:hypothetical protein